MFERLKVALQSRVNSGELRSSCPRGRAAGTLSDAQEVLRPAEGSVTLNRQRGGGIGLRNDPLIKSEGPFPQNTFPKLNGGVCRSISLAGTEGVITRRDKAKWPLGARSD